MARITVYHVINSHSIPLWVKHTFTNDQGFEYSMETWEPAMTRTTYHVRDIAGVPHPFDGSLLLTSPGYFSAYLDLYGDPGRKKRQGQLTMGVM
jgi:hypothetical protein